MLVHFLREDLRRRFEGSVLGISWAFAQPLMLLAVYAIVFTRIMPARIPGLESAGGYVAFLATGLWPWLAFSEASLRASTAIQDNAALLGKIALPKQVLVEARILSAGLLHSAGFFAVALILLLLDVEGVSLDAFWTLLAWPMLMPWALALGYSSAALQVFLRDTAQVMAQLLTLLFFLTPILYAPDMVPDEVRALLVYNPIAVIIDFARSHALGQATPSFPAVAAVMVVGLILAALARAFFLRCASHFEDFH